MPATPRAIVAAVLVVCVVRSQTRTAPPPGTSALSVRALWTEDASRVGSTGGDWISLNLQGPALDLVVRNVRTGIARNMTGSRVKGEESASAETSCLSPDGKSIAYAWHVGGREQHKEYDLMVAGTDGTPPRRVVSQLPWLSPIAWTPDRESVLVVTSRADGNPQERDAIEVVRVDDGARRTVLRLPFPPGPNPSLSPNGRTIAMQQRRAGNPLLYEINLIDVMSGAVTRYRHQRDDRNPVWIPGGSGFVFLSDGDKPGLWFQPVVEGRIASAARLLSKGFDSEMLPSAGPDGSILFRKNTGSSGVYRIGFDAVTGTISGVPERISERVSGESLAPSWAPDGNSVAWIAVKTLSTQPQSGRLVILDRGRLLEHSLPFGVARGAGASWSSDGRSLFLPGTDIESGLERLFRIDAATGASTALPIRSVENTKLRVGRPFPAVTADGTSAFVSRNYRLFRVDLSTGQETTLFDWTLPEILYSVTVSPDGKKLALGLPRPDSKPRLAIMPVEGGTPEVLYSGPELNPTLGVSWESDGSGILIVSGNGEVVRFSMRDRTFRGTGLRVPGLSFPSLNPTRSQMVYQVSQPKIELWTIERIGAAVRKQ